jgi:hypothetical protein
MKVSAAAFVAAVATLSSSSSSSTAVSAAPCLQTNFGDVSFAGGMTYDHQHDVMYLTGQVGPSSCFVGVAKFTDNGDEETSKIQLLSRQVFEESAVCQSLILRQDQPSSPLLLAVMDEGGLLTDTRPRGSQKSLQYGAMIELQYNSAGTSSNYVVPNSVLMHQDVVQVPRSIVIDPKLRHRAYVASMATQSTVVNSEEKAIVAAADGRSTDIQDLTPGGAFKYGSNFVMMIEEIRLSTENTAAHSNWRRPFGEQAKASDDIGATVNQMVYFAPDDSLLIVGEATGSGDAFGYNGLGLDGGYIAKLNANDGKLVESKRINFDYGDGDVASDIEAICYDEADPTAIYVVGAYLNLKNGVSTPYLMKLGSDDFDLWYDVSFPSTQDAWPTACTVQGGTLYVAGNINDNGVFNGSPANEVTVSRGQSDVFLIKINADNGDIHWFKQFGTDGDDMLAENGNGLVMLPDQRGVLLMGDTTGTMYTTKPTEVKEIFVVHVDKYGNTPLTSEASNTDYSEAAKDVEITNPTKVVESRFGNDDGSIVGDSSVSYTSSSEFQDQLVAVTTSVYFLATVGIVAFLLCTCLVCIKQREHERNTSRALVFSYLQTFDVEDIDVRQSATGGWHGTYVGKLAQGRVYGSNVERLDVHSDDEDDEFFSDIGNSGKTLLSGFSHSSIVRDSLFVDYDMTPSYGHTSDSSGMGGGGGGGGYRDAVDEVIENGSNTRRGSFTDSFRDEVINDDDGHGDEDSSYVRDPKFYSDTPIDRTDADGFNLARLSTKQRSSPPKGGGGGGGGSDPWGADII